jgi:hypothetical protein
MINMARKIIEVCTCDVCGGNKILNYERDMQVVFTTERTEGRSCKPYLDVVTLDICNGCLEEIYNGRQLMGAGAQGCYSYFFRKIRD